MINISRGISANQYIHEMNVVVGKKICVHSNSYEQNIFNNTPKF